MPRLLLRSALRPCVAANAPTRGNPKGSVFRDFPSRIIGYADRHPRSSRGAEAEMCEPTGKAFMCLVHTSAIMLQQIAKAATMATLAVLLTAPLAAAEQGGRYWVPKTTADPARYSQPTATAPAPDPTDNYHPNPVFQIDHEDGSRQAWAVGCEKAGETVCHRAGAEAIPSRCDGPGRPRFQAAFFDPAGQHE